MWRSRFREKVRSSLRHVRFDVLERLKQGETGAKRAVRYPGALLGRNRWAMSLLLKNLCWDVCACVCVQVPAPVPCLKECTDVCMPECVGSCFSGICVCAVHVTGGWRCVGLCLWGRKKMSIPSCWSANVSGESKPFPHRPGDWTLATVTWWVNQLFPCLRRRTWVFASN